MDHQCRFSVLLPIKHHSQRVPGKNFKILGTKPLYRWILDELLDCSFIDEILIDTDSDTLLEDHELQTASKVHLVERPTHLRGHEVSMNEIIRHDLGRATHESIIMTHTTSPFLKRATFEDAISIFLKTNRFDSLFGVNIIQSRLYDKLGAPLNHDPLNLIQTQDLDPIYEENSSLYIFTKQSFNITGARIGMTPYLYPTPKIESFDIDTLEDWSLAATLAETGSR